jgi:hypothetical protein
MPISRAALRLFGIAFLSHCAAASAFAQLSATAVIRTSSSSAPYNYTIDVHNTGNTNIGTFWFAWDSYSDYNFLPSLPTNITAPAGWINPVTHLFSGDGYGIEFYNQSGSPIAPGATGQFHFTISDSPATLSGNAWYPPYKVTSSYVYIGAPLSDAGYNVVASVSTVPEPASVAIFLTGSACGCLFCRRRRSLNSTR